MKLNVLWFLFVGLSLLQFVFVILSVYKSLHTLS